MRTSNMEMMDNIAERYRIRNVENLFPIGQGVEPFHELGGIVALAHLAEVGVLVPDRFDLATASVTKAQQEKWHL